MEHDSLQQQFFEYIRNKLPKQTALTEKVAEILNISTDSAYKRIDGDKLVDLKELKKLASHYKISIDQFLQQENHAFLFFDRSLASNTAFHFELYLKALIDDLTLMLSFENKRLYCLNKDIPIFYHFSFPELAAFKCFFWMKTIAHNPEFVKERFSVEKYIDHFVEPCKKISLLYAQIPSVEIWNVENINSTINQIEYYRETGSFLSKKDIEKVYTALAKTIDQAELNADNSSKNIPGSPSLQGAEYEVYINEFILGDNTYLVELNDTKFAYLNHGVINYMVTKDEKFCNFTYDSFQNIIKRSTLISGVNEKDRMIFFMKIKDRINNRIAALG